MDKLDLLITARLERERAQKAQFTAMVLREVAAETRRRHVSLRRALALLRDQEQGWVGDLAL